MRIAGATLWFPHHVPLLGAIPMWTCVAAIAFASSWSALRSERSAYWAFCGFAPSDAPPNAAALAATANELAKTAKAFARRAALACRALLRRCRGGGGGGSDRGCFFAHRAAASSGALAMHCAARVAILGAVYVKYRAAAPPPLRASSPAAAVAASAAAASAALSLSQSPPPLTNDAVNALYVPNYGLLPSAACCAALGCASALCAASRASPRLRLLPRHPPEWIVLLVLFYVHVACLALASSRVAASSHSIVIPASRLYMHLAVTVLTGLLPVRAAHACLLLLCRSAAFALLPPRGYWPAIAPAPGWPPPHVTHAAVACCLAVRAVTAEARAYRAWARAEGGKHA